MSLIVPIKELRNTVKMSELCHNSDEPVYITKNGYGDMVIMSIEYYESMTGSKQRQAPRELSPAPQKASVQADSEQSEEELTEEKLNERMVKMGLRMAPAAEGGDNVL